MKYLKLFENHRQYEDYAASGLTLPNVSHCIQEIEVHYNPIVPPDYSQEYLTFEALEDGGFTFSEAINYSTDGGTTWTELAANTPTPNIASGNKIMWKATLTPSSSSYPYGIGIFSSSRNFNVEGNPMSLLFGDNFVGQIDLTRKNHAFVQLFNNCSRLFSAKNLSLPATTLAPNCYSYMFNGCTNLTTPPQLPATTLATYCYQYMFTTCTSLTIAPELPATTLAAYCYDGMFDGCTKLNYIKAMFTTKPTTLYTKNWVRNVASSGTFVKNSAATWNVSGVNGVPTGWTVETA